MDSSQRVLAFLGCAVTREGRRTQRHYSSFVVRSSALTSLALQEDQGPTIEWEKWRGEATVVDIGAEFSTMQVEGSRVFVVGMQEQAEDEVPLTVYNFSLGARKKQGNPPYTLQHLGLTLPQLTPQGPGTWKVSADTVVLFDVRWFDFVYPCLVLRLTPGLFGSPGRRMVHHRHHLVSLNLYSSPFGNCWWILLIILTTSNVASHSRREYHMRTTPAADKWRIHSDFTLCPRSVSIE